MSEIVEAFGEVSLMGQQIVEMTFEQGIEYYKDDDEDFDFEDFKKVIDASLSPARFEILKIACEELTTSRKDYHIVMSFIEKIEEIKDEILEEIEEERDD